MQKYNIFTKFEVCQLNVTRFTSAGCALTGGARVTSYTRCIRYSSWSIVHLYLFDRLAETGSIWTKLGRQTGHYSDLVAFRRNRSSASDMRRWNENRVSSGTVYHAPFGPHDRHVTSHILRGQIVFFLGGGRKKLGTAAYVNLLWISQNNSC